MIMRFSYSSNSQEIDVSGTRIELTNLAEYFSKGKGILDGQKEGDPYPYRAFAGCLEIKKVKDSLVNFRVILGKIIVQGDLQKLSIISENILDLVSNSGCGTHMHIEYFEDHPYLCAESIPVIVSCMQRAGNE
jgi:hypothetical protein